MPTNAVVVISTPSPDRNRKIVRQSPTASSPLPIAGATTGPISEKDARVPYIAAARGPAYRSLTTARPTATPTPATRPCTPRSATSVQPVGANAQSSDTSVKVVAPPRIMPRRPRPSLTGPASSWPTAMPAMKKVIVSCTTVELVPSARAHLGERGEVGVGGERADAGHEDERQDPGPPGAEGEGHRHDCTGRDEPGPADEARRGTGQTEPRTRGGLTCRRSSWVGPGSIR